MESRTPALVAAAILTVFLWIACDTQEPIPLREVLIVVNKSDSNAALIDVESGTRLGTFVTGVGPHEIAYSEVSGLAVISNYGTRENPGSSLTVIDVPGLKVLRTIDLAKYRLPHGLEFFQEGQRLAVTVEGSEAVLVVNAVSGQIEKVLPTGQELSHLLALSPDNLTVYSTNMAKGTLSVLDVTESRLLKTLSVGSGAEGIDVSPDGRELWIANRAENSLSIVETEGLEVIERIPCEDFPIRVRFTPDGSTVLVSNARSGDLAFFSVETRKEIDRIPLGITEEEEADPLIEFDLSPVPVGILVDASGQRAFVANSNADVVTVIDLKLRRIAARLSTGDGPDGMILTSLHLKLPAQIEVE